jgi:hypothetical protein
MKSIGYDRVAISQKSTCVGLFQTCPEGVNYKLIFLIL